VVCIGKHICVVGNDRRLIWAAKEFQAAGHSVSFYGVPETEDTVLSLSETVKNAQAVVLPMPAADSSGCIRFSDSRSCDYGSFLAFVPNDALIFGGMLPSGNDPRIVDYGKAEAVALANAVPTAEGAIQRAMEHLPITLWNSQCLVIGFGRIGKILAHRLQGLGVHVTVCARKQEDLTYAQTLGYSTDITDIYQKGLVQYDCIFNTVPAPVLSEAQLRQTNPNCLLMDLASAPGGIDAVVCAAIPRPHLHALSLPAQVAPVTAGKIIAGFILTQL